MLWYKKRLLNEADIRDEDDEDDLHIYSDELTGDLYYFDGEKLIKLKNGSQENPDDPGDDDEFKKLEDEARKKQIEKERKEKEEHPEDFEDEDEDFNDETEEERAARIKSIEDQLSNKEVKNLIDIEDQTRKENEKREKEEKEKAANWKKLDLPSQGLDGFKLALKSFLRREVDNAEPEYTYSKLNKTYARSKIIKPGINRFAENNKVPSINVYFDQSGSWRLRDIQIGMQALKTLDSYVKNGQIKVNLFYFSNSVSEDRNRVAGGGTNCPAVVQHIIDTKPDNAIIMTDSDGDKFYSYSDYKTVILKGTVWWLWKQGLRSQNFRAHVLGRKNNKDFDI